MHAVVFDCEFLTNEGAPSRFWCGPFDPDPIVVQIGLARIQLANEFPISNLLKINVIPRDRLGNRTALDPHFTDLTGITEKTITEEGIELSAALEAVAVFCGDAKLWSWGKDEFNLIAISCYIQGMVPPIPATRFANVCQLMLTCGMPYADIKKTRSHQLAAYFGVDPGGLKAHDALDDARSTALVIQHLLRSGKLSAKDLQ